MAGIALGAHGASHLPLTMLTDPAADLHRARGILEREIESLGLPFDALSFPHGRYDVDTIEAAHAAGFSILFTSDPCVNITPAGRPSPLLGRIPINTAAIADTTGVFAPSRLATWLFNRPAEWLHA